MRFWVLRSNPAVLGVPIATVTPDADQAFRADEPDPDHRPVGQRRHHGDHPLLDEVDMIDGLVWR